MRVELRRTQNGYSISVSDSGPGIPPESQPYIFERFYRVDRARSRATSDGGAGLGLALARWVSRVHGGDLVLTASSANGCTFTAVLPQTG